MARTDPATRGIIYSGASASQLGALFHMRPADVYRRLGDLQPVGTAAQGNPLYDVAEAAARLIKPEITPAMIDQYMRKVNHAHLPPLTSRFYWLGKKERDKYLESVNELWFSDAVVRVAGESFQAIRMVLIMLPDVLREGAGLNDGQFRLVQTILDNAIEDCCARLVTALRKPGFDPVGPGPSDEEGALPEC